MSEKLEQGFSQEDINIIKGAYYGAVEELGMELCAKAIAQASVEAYQDVSTEV